MRNNSAEYITSKDKRLIKNKFKSHRHLERLEDEDRKITSGKPLYLQSSQEISNRKYKTQQFQNLLNTKDRDYKMT